MFGYVALNGVKHLACRARDPSRRKKRAVKDDILALFVIQSSR